MKRAAEADPNELNDIFNKFAQTINNIITLVLKQTPKEDIEDIVEIERLKRIINLLPIDERMYRCKDKIWMARNQLIEKDHEWFYNRSFKHLIKKDAKQVMIETLMGMVRRKFKTLSKEEQDIYWDLLHKMLHLVARYKKLVNEL